MTHPLVRLGALGQSPWYDFITRDLVRSFGAHRAVDGTLFSWVPTAGLHIDFGLRADQLSVCFVLLITGVGTLIHVYSIGYMAHDPDRRRFFAYLNLFVAAMLLLVLADNYFGLYVGWEGVGLASYLLIGFWSYKPSAATAAKKAFVVNRVGDIGLAVALLGRFSVAAVFWKSGQTKVQGLALDPIAGEWQLGWPSLAPQAVDLFRDEYKLPLLDPQVAAVLAASRKHRRASPIPPAMHRQAGSFGSVPEKDGRKASCPCQAASAGCTSRQPLPMPPLVVVAWQVGLGCLAMLILGILFEHPNVGAITPLGAACFVYMTLVPMGICYLTWFETLRRLPPTSASIGMLLVPVIAVIAAAAILGEPLGLREIGAMALTLGGVTLALRRE